MGWSSPIDQRVTGKVVINIKKLGVALQNPSRPAHFSGNGIAYGIPVSTFTAFQRSLKKTLFDELNLWGLCLRIEGKHGKDKQLVSLFLNQSDVFPALSKSVVGSTCFLFRFPVRGENQSLVAVLPFPKNNEPLVVVNE